MQIVRARLSDGAPAVSAVLAEDGLHPLSLEIHELLSWSAADLRTAVEMAVAAAPVPAPGHVLQAPVSGLTEVWAAGVTYERSREARMEESEKEADIYDRVYDAERPELFFKGASWRVAGTGEPVSVRADSPVNVPEPELAVVANAYGEIVGYTICNDVSSRSIEGENPLYLPQAKAYLGACAVGPGITPAWEVSDPRALPILMSIERGGEVVWKGEASTAQLHRRLEDLVGYLFREDDFPQGVVLATGTSLVPDLPFTLEGGDVVSIELVGLGVLTNPVVVGKAGIAHLVHRVQEVPAR
ncbi:fumarylacetoacetate hydrolase family protein [Nocardioides mangrovi]|uniref:Fumarylacetoacetate hydrolase family protein n=1 Tax=Nocardioides mangrovi TaxID=2874580 RepID=A0ABS7UJJ1_9ACTN|nr:fumarylacetoacetate hydrolase family protein [Nocardioides mangrovi]MBZ5740985.1 fumarylacetoacetate hydrolase family protein [Nocardioides mangrovi]